MCLDKYQDIVYEYSKDVVSGKIIAGEKIKLACERHLKDLERIGDEDFPYIYEPLATEKILKFASLLRDLESHKQLKLAKFQKFILGSLVGWKKLDGANRFSNIYITMARANGKTMLISIIMLYQFLFGKPKQNRQLAVASADLPHADSLFKYTKNLYTNLIDEDAKFAQLADSLNIETNQSEMRMTQKLVSLTKLSASSSTTSDGLGHFSTCVVDETHLFRDREFLNSITSGQTFLDNSQIIYISTAGNQLSGPLYQDYKRLSEVLEKGDFSNNETTLFLIWEQDNDDEVYKPDTWQKSNPLFELDSKKNTAIPKMINERDTLASVGKLPDFITKNLNRWQNAKDDAYLKIDWIENSIIDRNKFDIKGKDVYVGFDYSIMNDDTSLSFVFPYIENGVEKFHLYQHAFVPLANSGTIEAKSKRDNINYQYAEELGFATITHDRHGMIDQDQVFNWLLNFIEDNKLNVINISYDNWGTGDFINRLAEIKDDYMLLPVKQTIYYLTEPTVFLKKGFINGRITMFNDPVLKQAFINAVIINNQNGIKIDKNKNSQKIDAVDATVDALFEGMYHFDNYTNVETDKHNPFGSMNTKQIDEYFKKEFTF